MSNTHLALTEAYLAEQGIEITSRFTFKDMKSIFIRDPDRNVIEFDEYPGDNPESRMTTTDDTYQLHT